MVSPDRQKTKQKIQEINIRLLRLPERSDEQAAGAESRAITNIMPTVLINATMLSAVMISNRYSKTQVRMPVTLAKFLSNKKAFQSLKKTEITIKTIIVSIAIIYKSLFVTDKIFPKR